MSRTLIFYTLLFAATTFVLYTLLSGSSHSQPAMSLSSLENWPSRATPSPNPDSFVPERSNLALIVLRNAPVENQGFTLAIFKDKTAVDAKGRVLTLTDADYEGLTSLATTVLDLPQTGEFRNTWRVKHLPTSQPIDRLLVGPELKETSVQGWTKGKKELKEPVAGLTELPEVLYDIFGLVLEGRKDFQRGEEGPIVQKVKDIVSEYL